MIDPKGERFTVHVDKGNVTGLTWNGDFRAKAILSFSDQMRADRLKRDMLGPGPYDGVDGEVLAQAIMLSSLAVRLTEWPKWWINGTEHSDTNLLQEVYNNVIRIRDEYFVKMEADGKKDQEELKQIAEKK